MLQPLKSDLLAGLTHGFFTREGGVSQGIYTSLNTGRGSSDERALVETNRNRIAAHMGVVPENLLTVWQCHSADVVHVTAPFAGGAPEVDAMVTTTPGLALSAMAADCAPVLFADEAAGVIGAAHSGWKGALGGVLEATIEAMRGLGARDIKAAIGPCISQRAYEVGPEFFEQFLDEAEGADRFFAQGVGDRMQFDLPGFALQRLRDAGADAEWLGHCTYGDPKRFFSYRRMTHEGESDYGRLLSVIRL